jgi:hypothetical protein
MSKYTLKCMSWDRTNMRFMVTGEKDSSHGIISVPIGEWRELVRCWGGATDMSIYEASVRAARRQKVQAAQAQAKTTLVKACANQRPRAAARAA